MRSLLAMLAIAMFVGTIGCNDAAPKPEPAPATKSEDGGDKKDESASKETASTGEMQEVSLSLPSMT